MVAGLVVLPPSSATQAPCRRRTRRRVRGRAGLRRPGPHRLLRRRGVGTYHARVVAADGTDSHDENLGRCAGRRVQPPGARSYVLSDALDKPGRYQVETWQEGTDVVSVATFTVAGAEPPTVLSQAAATAWRRTLKIDWSDAAIGYYDLDLLRVGVPASCCDWWKRCSATTRTVASSSTRWTPSP